MTAPIQACAAAHAEPTAALCSPASSRLAPPPHAWEAGAAARPATGTHRLLPAPLRRHCSVWLNFLKFTQRLFVNLFQMLFQGKIAVGEEPEILREYSRLFQCRRPGAGTGGRLQGAGVSPAAAANAGPSEAPASFRQEHTLPLRCPRALAGSSS